MDPHRQVGQGSVTLVGSLIVGLGSIIEFAESASSRSAPGIHYGLRVVRADPMDIPRLDETPATKAERRDAYSCGCVVRGDRKLP